MLIFKKPKSADSAIGNLSRDFIDSLDDIDTSEFKVDEITKTHKETEKQTR